MSFLAGLAESCEAAGQGLLLVPAGPGRATRRRRRGGAAGRVDGFRRVLRGRRRPYLAAVRERHLPTVICDQPREMSGASLVGIDDRGAMRKVADYLITLGHVEIGVLCMRLGRDRADGVVQGTSARPQLPRPARADRRRPGRDVRRRSGPVVAHGRRTLRAHRAVRHSAAAQAFAVNPKITAPCAPPTCSRSVRWTGHAARPRRSGPSVDHRLRRDRGGATRRPDHGASTAGGQGPPRRRAADVRVGLGRHDGRDARDRTGARAHAALPARALANLRVRTQQLCAPQQAQWLYACGWLPNERSATGRTPRPAGRWGPPRSPIA